MSLGQNHHPESTIEHDIVMGKGVDRVNLNFGRTILQSLKEYPNFIGMIDAKTGNQTTFAEMKNRSVRCALWLRKYGIGANDVVSISTPIQMNDYVPYLATLYINAIVNPWNYNESPENAQHFFEICRPKIMFACEQSIDKLVGIAKKMEIDCKFIAFEKHREHMCLDEIMSEQTQSEIDDFECVVPMKPREKVSQIIFSSGTTSTPKAIMLPYHSLLTRQMEECGMRNGMMCLWYTGFAWTIYSILMLAMIRLRCTRVIDNEFDADVTAKIVEKYKINFIFSRPHSLILWHQANVFERYDFSTVETIVFAGTKMNKPILEECQKSLPHTFLRGSYGTTEAGGFVSRQTENRKYIDSIGTVCSGVKLKVVDPNTGAILGPNQKGEIYLKTDYAMLGYLKNPEETKNTIDEEGWLRTGDLGCYDQDGEIMISDRLKAVIKMRYFTISPFEFEEILIQHPDVNDCAVVGVDHPVDIERPFVFVVKVRDSKVTAEELIEFAASKDERYRSTGGFVFVKELPYTPSGKKYLKKLQEMAQIYLKQ